MRDNFDIKEIRLYLGLSLLDKFIFETLFPKTRIPEDRILNSDNKTPLRAKIKTLKSIIDDCHTIRKMMEDHEITVKNRDMDGQMNKVLLSLLTLERKHEEIVEILTREFNNLFDYHDYETARDLIARVVEENDLDDPRCVFCVFKKHSTDHIA